MKCNNKFINYSNRSGACIGFNYAIDWVKDLVKEWYDLALIKECIAPPGSNRTNHRQDQAVFTLLYYQYQQIYGFNIVNEEFGYSIHNDAERIEEFNITLQQANELIEKSSRQVTCKVTFHCYWNGSLNEKHYYSIRSCKLFNKHNRIILWLESNIPNKWNELIAPYVEFKTFDLIEQHKGTFLENSKYYMNRKLSYYSDVVRYTLLYRYGGCWFDLDIYFLRSFDPLFEHYKNDITVYRWEYSNHPNGAIFICLQPENEKLKSIIEFIINRNLGWGFEEAQLTDDLNLGFNVLPCSWFDAGWLENPDKIKFNDFFTATKKTITFDNFFKGAFCYHWHNMWNKPIEKNSQMDQLNQII